MARRGTSSPASGNAVPDEYLKLRICHAAEIVFIRCHDLVQVEAPELAALHFGSDCRAQKSLCEPWFGGLERVRYRHHGFSGQYKVAITLLNCLQKRQRGALLWQ